MDFGRKGVDENEFCGPDKTCASAIVYMEYASFGLGMRNRPPAGEFLWVFAMVAVALFSIFAFWLRLHATPDAVQV